MPLKSTIIKIICWIIRRKKGHAIVANRRLPVDALYVIENLRPNVHR
jgi:hypothetical protein